MNIPDNYDMWEAHDREQAVELEKLPVCEICGKPVQDDCLYMLYDQSVCESCLLEECRKPVSDFLEV